MYKAYEEQKKVYDKKTEKRILMKAYKALKR